MIIIITAMMMVRSTYMKTSDMILLMIYSNARNATWRWLLCQSSFWLDPPTPYKQGQLCQNGVLQKNGEQLSAPRIFLLLPSNYCYYYSMCPGSRLTLPTLFLGQNLVLKIWSLYKNITFCNSALAVPTPNLGCYTKLNQYNCPRFHTVVFF